MPHSVGGIEAARRALENPLLTSDADLCRFLHLWNCSNPEEPTEQNLTAGQQLYYIRSWRLSAGVVYDIYELWNREDYKPPEMEKWMAAVEQGAEEIYIRYVGTCR